MPSDSHQQQPQPSVKDTKTNGESQPLLTSDEVKAGTKVVMTHAERQVFLKRSRLGQVAGVSHLLPEVTEETNGKQGVNGINIMDLAILASAAVSFFFTQTTGGALEKLGADVVDQLKGLIYTKFAGRAELRQASENPKILEAVIEEEASRDDIFRKQLEELVTRLQQIENNIPSDNVYQNAGESGVNQKIDSVSGGTVSGRDQIGRDQINFRR